MNNIAISPYVGMYALQIQNVKRNVAKTASIDELNLHKNTDINENENTNTNTNTNDNTEKNENTTTSIDSLPETIT